MVLRPADQEVLDELGCGCDLSTDGAFVAVVVKAFPLPRGLRPERSDMLFRLPPGFPDAAPDMFWFDPVVIGPDGVTIAGTESREAYLGRSWQRWSRHIAGQWRPGIDNLGTYLAYIRRCLDQAAGRAA